MRFFRDIPDYKTLYSEMKGRETMNIFSNYEGILGSAQTIHTCEQLEEFLKLARSIRGQLGKHAYLLDQYLLQLMEAVNSTLAQDASGDGMSDDGKLAVLCGRILRGKTTAEGHPLYQEVKEYIDLNPQSYLEDSTKSSLYKLTMYSSFLDSEIKGYSPKAIDALREEVDIVEIRKKYSEIGELISGENAMERLNLLFRQCFLVVNAMDCFRQGMNNGLLYTLTERDLETNKTLLQIWLEG